MFERYFNDAVIDLLGIPLQILKNTHSSLDLNYCADLILAIRNKKPDDLQKLIDQGKSKPRNVLYYNAGLLEAVSVGNYDIVKSLLERRANVNHQTLQYGITSLMISARNGHVSIVKLLFDFHADLNIKDKDGLKAYNYINNDKKEETISEFKKNKGFFKESSNFIRSLQTNLHKKSLITSLPKERKTKSPEERLFSTLEKGDFNSVCFLIEKKADIHLTTNNPLFFIIEKSRHDAEQYNSCAKVLIEFKAKLDAVNAQGKTSLMIAADKKNYSLIEFIIKYGIQNNVSILPFFDHPSEANELTLIIIAMLHELTENSKCVTQKQFEYLCNHPSYPMLEKKVLKNKENNFLFFTKNIEISKTLTSILPNPLINEVQEYCYTPFNHFFEMQTNKKEEGLLSVPPKINVF